jgi:hypothetical protein
MMKWRIMQKRKGHYMTQNLGRQEMRNLFADIQGAIYETSSKNQ